MGPIDTNVLLRLMCAFLVLAGGARATGAEVDGLIPSGEPGWPQWRGLRRDGVSHETGLLPSWPAAGGQLPSLQGTLRTQGARTPRASMGSPVP